MISALDTYVIHYPEHYDERGEWEAEAKGWLQGVVVETADALCYSVYFYDPVRLAQDLEANTAQDEPFIAEPGMIVVPEVTRPAMERSIQQLANRGYFDHLLPIPSDE